MVADMSRLNGHFDWLIRGGISGDDLMWEVKVGEEEVERRKAWWGK